MMSRCVTAGGLYRAKNRTVGGNLCQEQGCRGNLCQEQGCRGNLFQEQGCRGNLCQEQDCRVIWAKNRTRGNLCQEQDIVVAVWMAHCRFIASQKRKNDQM